MSWLPHQTHSRDSGWGTHTGLGSSTARQYGADANETGEGPLARAIEQQTARLPSDTWLWAAAGSIAVSLYFKTIGKDDKSLFVGQWAPTFLLLGIYNKLVKQHGSE